VNPFRLLPFLALVALALSGCVASTGYAVVSQRTAVSPVRGPNDAWAALPPQAGKVISVSERDTPPRLVQRIVLDGAGPIAGENFIAVATVSDQSPVSAFGPPPTPDSIDREMAAAFPGIDMRRTLAIETNRLGPFGTAFGDSAGYTCLYAWQRAGGSGEAFGPSAMPVEVRLRLCRKASRQTLLGYARALAVYVGPVTTLDVRSGGASLDPLAAAAGLVR
jgi:hypothetical protein